ncbi:MAG: hypothetical protein QNJ31_01535 [Candidatus Caenarcaniphilales bacterium]|nr:hypothetical protein [Candidatus Caenarcaniphilales bacterium]
MFTAIGRVVEKPTNLLKTSGERRFFNTNNNDMSTTFIRKIPNSGKEKLNTNIQPFLFGTVVSSGILLAISVILKDFLNMFHKLEIKNNAKALENP